MANMSLACQTLANVARDHLLVSPVSLYFLVVASSGERKSAADHAFGQAIHEWELKIRNDLAPVTALNKMSDRLAACLDESLSMDIAGCENIPILSFSTNAKNIWIKFFNTVEKGLINPTQWFTMKDFASKAAENAAPLATLFHFFDGKQGAIETETVERAINIIEWHLWETKRMLHVETDSRHQQDAMRLIQWLKSKSLSQTTPRQLQQFSPIRDKKRRDEAIQHLIESAYLKEIKNECKTILLVNPTILSGNE
ncbi:MAG: DUF3987 domain-containing protein [Legionellales bacterium]|nr:DUF3987 domain-containing protein [Legionellales bacterium]